MLWIVLCLLLSYIGEFTALYENDTGTDQFPFFAQLVFSLKRERRMDPRISPSYFICGATLIHPRWILTAARCFPNDTLGLESIEMSTDNEVYMGGVKYRTASVQNSIIKIYRHPSFQWIKYGGTERVNHDIAVAKMRGPFRTSQHVQVIPLPQKSDFLKTCKPGMAIGTGQTSSRYSIPSYTVPYMKVNPKQLSEALAQSGTLFYSETMRSRSHSLRNNLGGPFVCNSSRGLMQYGVMSQHIQHRRTIVITYERVDKYLEFIFQYVPDLNKKWNGIRTRKSYNHVRSDGWSLKSDFSYLILLTFWYIIY